VTFTLRLAPYQLYPDFSTEGVSKYEWYKTEKYSDSAERMQMYIDYMTALGKDDNIPFDFNNGVIANTFHAHRTLHCVQATHGPEAAISALLSLYKQYFEEGQHPSSPSTLIKAYLAAGLSEQEAKEVVEGEEMTRETKTAIQEQVGNAVDSVPYVVVEGRRRDFTLVGAKGIGEYEKALAQVVKEVS
jgi:predicted DsbA family dithiol-disulfide isomerase